MADLISPAILKQLAPNCPNPEIWSEQLNSICPLYGINSPDIFHEFIANALVESGEFTDLEENLNYRAEALIEKFSGRISKEDAVKYGRTSDHKANQPEIANCIYGGAWGQKNLGNTEPNDGWDMRGSGVMQLTGRYNIGQFAKYYNKANAATLKVEEVAHLLRTDPKCAIHGACWFFAIAKQLLDEAVNDQMQAIIKRINGGMFGKAERLAYYEKAKQLIQ